MRILFSTAIALFVCFVFFLIIKLWGQGQVYSAYQHPFFPADSISKPLEFKVLTPKIFKENNKNSDLKFDGYYLNVAMSADQKMILIDPKYELQKKESSGKNFRYNDKNFSELADSNSDSAILFSEIISFIQNKKIIFNFLENPLQIQAVFTKAINEAQIQSGNQFIFVSSYEPPAKAIKEDHPTFLFGTTQPEILKIKSMESFYLIEAAIFRADVLIHPLKYYKRDFFTENIVTEMRRRQKKIIVGPNIENLKSELLKIKPDGIIIE